MTMRKRGDARTMWMGNEGKRKHTDLIRHCCLDLAAFEFDVERLEAVRATVPLLLTGMK
jgi:hypothetical protein